MANINKVASKKNEESTNEGRYRAGTTDHRLKISSKESILYQATADWITILKKDRPAARMFYTAYVKRVKSSESRPLTFIFNGGPGAASAYLHLGAVGPQRIVFGASGEIPPPPVRLVDNKESWLTFSDLVFIDPVGTGFSRIISDTLTKPASKDSEIDSQNQKCDVSSEHKVAETEYWEITSDLDSICAFIETYLSKNQRWSSPIYIAGESYGGFRVAKLARRLQENHGVGLNGAILISPAIEFSSLCHSDYDVIHWVETLPSLAATAFHHKRAATKLPLNNFLAEVENFALGDYAQFLIQGTLMAEKQRQSVILQLSKVLGLASELIERHSGRIPITVLSRELLRSERLFCGLYDSSVTTIDPFPDRSNFEGPDPTLFSIDRLYAAGINHHLRKNLEIQTDLRYHLLSFEVNDKWRNSGSEKLFGGIVGAMDDLRYGMSLNPHMQVYICHGYFDLVTPYFSSHRLVQHMKLLASQKKNLTVKQYSGGHMFYSWDPSRIAFTNSIRKLYGFKGKN